MRIAVCLNKIQPRDGTSHFATQLGDLLMDAGHRVTLVAAVQSQPHELAHISPRLAYVSTHPLRWESMATNLSKIGRLFRQQSFDVAFICLGVPPRYLEHFVYRLPEATAIVPVLGTDRLFAYDPLVRSAAAWNVAVAESPRLLDAIQTRLPGKPVRLLTTGIPHPSDAELAARAPLTTPLRLLFVGRLAGRKNVHMLPGILQACLQRGIDATLTVCGSGPDREPLVQACHAAGVAHLVEFPDIPWQAELYQTYRQHHVLLLTSSYGEGLGLVLLEAQANGCVPVASRLLGVTDFTIEEDVTGRLAEIKNTDSFAEQIVALTSPERWPRFSQAGIARTRELFTFEAMARDYGELLADLQRGAYALPRLRANLPRPSLRRGAYVPPALRPMLRLYARLRPDRQPTTVQDPDPE
ncbi:hypothetical protein BH10CHL1_BH10CHL1_40770 [soil metagenome]